MNAFDLSPAQIRNRLILRARQSAMADRTAPHHERHHRGEVVLVVRVRLDVSRRGDRPWAFHDGFDES
ncbi:hypothetical protein [Micromonospora sp. C95]|uniref:hypothetical protein n=1 Tax=Micromonospora sp. C95 TaxID=2824882 RepID=UPI001B36C3D7|nr:hypothetical protein [Micromonospora sp. C95]MBQ1026511.1 hypothetical protein [Micromonospora sp. C95]